MAAKPTKVPIPTENREHQESGVTKKCQAICINQYLVNPPTPAQQAKPHSLVKNQPHTDGKQPSGTLLLEGCKPKNGYLLNKQGHPAINHTELAAP